MIIDIPDGIDLRELAFVGLTHLVSRTDDQITLLWIYNEAETELVIDLPARTLTIPDEATDQIAIIEARLSELTSPPVWRPVYDWLITEYESYAGRSITQLRNLTDAALLRVITVLVIALLYEAKAFDRDMTLRPLNDWVRRK